MKSKKRSLGRGLDAILQSPETDITSRDISGDYVAGAIAAIPLAQIESNPFQPRSEFEDSQLQELALSIKEQGIIQPLTIRKLGYDRYQLIAGERRYRAAHLVGLKEVPCYIRVANDEQMLEMALIENIHRVDLNPIDIAISYQRLIEECKLTQESLSEKVSKDRATVSNYIRLLRLPAEIQLALKERSISMGHAKAILSLTHPSDQLKLAMRIVQNDLSVREAERISREKGKAAPAARKEPLPASFENAREELKEHLRAPVTIQKDNNGKGSIVIRFGSETEFKRIVTLIRQSK